MSASTSLPVKVRRDPVFPSAPGPFFEIAVGEWKLQTRSWGSWLLVLLCLLVVVSEHPLFTSHSGPASLAESAATWADRIAVFGSMMAILIAPFVLDRVRRAGAAEVELSKPFPGGAYVLGKLAGVAGFTLAAILGSGVVHMGITLFGGADLVQAAWAYAGQAVQIALPPVVFALAAGFFLSIWIHPVAVTAGYVVYLVNGSLSQSAANARLSWLSPMVRPDYFHYAIPPEWQPVVNAHITLYYALSLALAVLAVTLFNRQNFLDGRARKSLKEWLRLSMDVAGRMGRLPVLSPSLRRVLGIPTLVALLLAVAIPSMTLQAGLEFTDLRIDHAFLALEFYLSLCGLLFMAGGLGLDQSSRALDLVLVKPANRWRLLAERLLPGLGIYLFLSLGMAAYIHFTYEPLPLLKAVLVPIATGLYLGLVGMTVSNLSHSALAGYGAGLIYWIFEAGFQGVLTAPFFLLSTTHQPQAGEFWRNPDLWLPAKLGLLVLSVGLFAANGWLVDAGPNRRRVLALLCIGIPLVFALGWVIIPRLAI